MGNDNEIRKDPDNKTVDEILADIDRKTAISESLEENTDENDMSDIEVLSQEESYEDSAQDDESISEELSGADEVSDEQEAFEEESAAEFEDDEKNAEEPDNDGEVKAVEKKHNIFYRMAKGVIPWKGDNAGLIIRKIIFIVALIVFLATAIPLLVDQRSADKQPYIADVSARRYRCSGGQYGRSAVFQEAA